MATKQIESTAARLLRLSRQVADLEYRIQTAGSPDQARRLGVQLRDMREGLRLTQLKA
jgi:hypothetical protein